jgi:F-type H+-transporting ATPase subunit epsilon
MAERYTPLINLKVITPKDLVFTERVEAVTLPGTLGQMTVLPNHIMLVSSLKPGKMYFKQTESDGTEKITFYEIGRGFVEVEKNTVTILTQTAKMLEIS